MGTVWGGVWEAKIVDFRTFFNVFSKLFLNNVLEGQKVDKNSLLGKVSGHFGSARRNARPAGERKREGSEASGGRRYRKELGESRIRQEV